MIFRETLEYLCIWSFIFVFYKGSRASGQVAFSVIIWKIPTLEIPLTLAEVNINNTFYYIRHLPLLKDLLSLLFSISKGWPSHILLVLTIVFILSNPLPIFIPLPA